MWFITQLQIQNVLYCLRSQYVENTQKTATSERSANMIPVFKQHAEDGERNGNLHNPQEQRNSEGTADSDSNNDGTWGERDVGGPVNFRVAMQDVSITLLPNTIAMVIQIKRDR